MSTHPEGKIVQVSPSEASRLAVSFVCIDLFEQIFCPGLYKLSADDDCYLDMIIVN